MFLFAFCNHNNTTTTTRIVDSPLTLLNTLPQHTCIVSIPLRKPLMSYTKRRRNGTSQPTSITSIATKALAAYGAYKIASWAWTKLGKDADDEEDFTQNEHASPHNSPRRQNHHSSKAFMRKRQAQLHKCNRETITTLGTFLNAMKSSVESLSDYSQHTKILKKMRAGNVTSESGHGDSDCDVNPSKQELWNEIKTQSVTRMISTVYAHTILTLLLTVQINLLGGRIFREKLDPGDAGHSNLAQGGDTEGTGEDSKGGTSHQVLMQTYEYFFQHGLKALVDDIRKVVQAETEEWEVVKKEEEHSVGSITLQQFDDGIHRIRQALEDISFGQYICQFDDTVENEEVRLIMDETLDIIESPVFEISLMNVVNVTFDILRDKGYSTLFGDGDATEPQPLVQIVTKLKRISNSFYSSPDESTEDRWAEKPMSSYPNVYLFHLDRIESVKELGDVSFN